MGALATSEASREGGGVYDVKKGGGIGSSDVTYRRVAVVRRFLERAPSHLNELASILLELAGAPLLDLNTELFHGD